jgi:hypothetical protein
MVAKTLGQTTIELLLRDYQERDERPDDVKRAITAIQNAAAEGRTDELYELLDTHGDLLDARGVDFPAATRLSCICSSPTGTPLARSGSSTEAWM